MTRPFLLHPVLGLSALGLGGCGETTLTEPRPAVPAATTVALPSNSWTAKAPMPGAFWRYDSDAGVANNPAGESIVYVFGGRLRDQLRQDPPETTILAYDVATDTWTRKRARFAGAATNGVGKIGSRLYISGGWDFSAEPFPLDVSSRLVAYDLVHDRIIRRADMPRATADGITGVIDGKLYVLAGKCLNTSCNQLYRYDPATNVWTTLAPCPRSHWRGAGSVIAGKLYVAGGGFSRPFMSFDVYDPATNTWESRGNMPPRRELAVGATLGGRFHVIGYGPPTDRNTVAYNPAANTWRNRAPWPEDERASEGRFISHPSSAVRVTFEGRSRILAVGAGLFLSDAGSVPAPTMMYTP